jgi:hypothetical protein
MPKFKTNSKKEREKEKQRFMETQRANSPLQKISKHWSRFRVKRTCQSSYMYLLSKSCKLLFFIAELEFEILK